MHRDIKPDNMMMGMGDKSNILYLIDFGLTKSVIDPKSGKHIPFLKGKNLVGTCRFVSLNAHHGYEISRRDDLYTLGFVMINFYKGYLPWQNLPINVNSARFHSLGQAKQKSMDDGSLFDDCPPFFKMYMDVVRNQAFEECADFHSLKNFVEQTARNYNIDIFDGIFDWSLVLTRQDTMSIPDTNSVLRSPERRKNYNEII